MHTGCITYGNVNLAITVFQLPSPHRSDGSLRLFKPRSDISASALPLKADMCGASADVRYGPIADIGSTSNVQEPAPEVRGKITLISANSPGSVSTSIEPHCCLTMMS